MGVASHVTKKVYHTQERGCKQLLYSIRMVTRRSEGERRTKNYLNKGCWDRAKQSGVEELTCTESVGQAAWRPYAPTGSIRHDDDDHWYASENPNTKIISLLYFFASFINISMSYNWNSMDRSVPFRLNTHTYQHGQIQIRRTL